MHRHRIVGGIFVLGATLLVVSAVSLLAVEPAEAQCGSQASSCKNCHETQGQDPVNADGTGWHESHAFGDFCYLCHGGNNQSLEVDVAHAGMVAPMGDVQTACAQCHPNDLQARSDVYTVALGMPSAVVGASAGQAEGSTAGDSAAEDQPQQAAPPPASISVGDPSVVDYVARYNQEVLHQEPTNWGNVILIVILVGMVGTGLFLINKREGWIAVTFSEKKPVGKEYSPDVLGIADQLESLGGARRKALARLLRRPGAAEVLEALDKFSEGEGTDA